MSETWIPTTDRYPIQHERVLTWHSKHKRVGLNEFYVDWKGVAYWAGVRDADMDISHWRPLPEGPKEAQE